MGGYPGGGGYGGGGGYRGGGRDNEPEVSLEDLLENVEVMKQKVRDMKVDHLPCTSPCCLPAPSITSGVLSRVPNMLIMAQCVKRTGDSYSDDDRFVCTDVCHGCIGCAHLHLSSEGCCRRS